MTVTTQHIGKDYKVLVDGITVASTDSERELEALVEYYRGRTDNERPNDKG